MPDGADAAPLLLLTGVGVGDVRDVQQDHDVPIAVIGTPQRVRIDADELERLDKDELYIKWRAQDEYLDYLEEKLCALSASLSSSNEELVEKLRSQLTEATKKESVLAMRLVTKDQEQQDLLTQIADLKAAAVPGISALRSHLVDPAVNFVFSNMKKEQEVLKQKLEDVQSELNAWKFTPDSQRGKLLMAKCRQLYQENEELGKVISSGRWAKLEGDLALHKNFCKELKKSQTELEELLGEQDEDIEGMQSIIYILQKEVRQLKGENERLRTGKPVEEEDEENVEKDLVNGNDDDEVDDENELEIDETDNRDEEEEKVNSRERTNGRTEREEEEGEGNEEREEVYLSARNLRNRWRDSLSEAPPGKRRKVEEDGAEEARVGKEESEDVPNGLA